MRMKMKAVRSLREMTRLLDTDQRLRKLCLIRKGESGYLRSVISRFTVKVGEDNLNKIIDEKVVKLLKSSQQKKLTSCWMLLSLKLGAHETQQTTRQGTLMQMQELDEQAEHSGSVTNCIYQ